MLFACCGRCYFAEQRSYAVVKCYLPAVVSGYVAGYNTALVNCGPTFIGLGTTVFACCGSLLRCGTTFIC